MKHQNKGLRLFIIIVLSLGAIVMMFPFFWMIITSLKPASEAMLVPPTIWSDNFSLDAYKELFDTIPFFRYLFNTLVVVAISFIGLLFIAMAGYAFAKFDFKGKEIYFLMVLATMMIPFQVVMIPNYLTLNAMGLINTFIGMALPGMITGFGVFLFRQFMTTIPDEVIEAARVEGIGELKIFFKLILPMSKPILSIQAILVFIGSWNSFMWPLIIAQDSQHYTLTVGMSLLQGQNAADYPLQLAGSTLMVIPVVIVFIKMQKNILDGYNMSGIK